MFRYIRNKLLRLYKWIRFKITGKYMVYLCGAMTSAADTCKIWRADVQKEFINENIIFIDPVATEKKKHGMDLKESIKKFKGWQQAGHRKFVRTNMQRIKKIDLNAVKMSDIIIAFWSNDIKTVGTISELDWSEEYNTPVYMFTPDNFGQLNPWLYFDTLLHPSDDCYMCHSLKDIFIAIRENFNIKKIKNETN